LPPNAVKRILSDYLTRVIDNIKILVNHADAIYSGSSQSFAAAGGVITPTGVTND
jgi:hypothetical protein